MKHQCFISSYDRDFCFLIHLLASLKRFAVGFLPPVVAVEPHDFDDACKIKNQVYPETEVVTLTGRKGQGMAGAMTRMLKSDIFCPDADVIYFLGSDCIAHETFQPEPYCDAEGRPAVLYTSYDTLERFHPQAVPWRRGVKRITGIYPQHEYMRRLPSVFPRSIFAPLRVHVEKLHRMDFEDYIFRADDGTTSEANILGAFAYTHMRETCCWVDTDEAGYEGAQIKGWPNAIGQMWSKGGLDRPSDACWEYKFRGVTMNAKGATPREIINRVLYPELA